MFRAIGSELLEWLTILTVLAGVAVGVATYLTLWMLLVPLQLIRRRRVAVSSGERSLTEDDKSLDLDAPSDPATVQTLRAA